MILHTELLKKQRMKKHITHTTLRELDAAWETDMQLLIAKHSRKLRKENIIPHQSVPILAAYNAKIDLLKTKKMLTEQEIDLLKLRLSEDDTTITLIGSLSPDTPTNPTDPAAELEGNLELNNLQLLAWNLETEIEAKEQFVKHFNVRLLQKF